MDDLSQGRLPFADQMVIEESKLVDYLFNPDPPQGRGKAFFLTRLGFSREQPDVLRAALQELAHSLHVSETTSKYGKKFVGTGILRSPTGRTARVTLVWIMLDGLPPPILVTAYPA